MTKVKLICVMGAETELNELERITKIGGLIILCPGNIDEDNDIHDFLINTGYEWSRFLEPGDGYKRKYWRYKE